MNVACFLYSLRLTQMTFFKFGLEIVDNYRETVNRTIFSDFAKHCIRIDSKNVLINNVDHISIEVIFY